MHEGKPIAGNVFFHFGKKALYKYGASDKNYQRLRANNLIMWEAIQWYCKNGYTHFCFGRTEPENDGLRQFKNGWGTREYDIRYYKYDLQRNEFIGESSGVAHRYKKYSPECPSPPSKRQASCSTGTWAEPYTLDPEPYTLYLYSIFPGGNHANPFC